MQAGDDDLWIYFVWPKASYSCRGDFSNEPHLSMGIFAIVTGTSIVTSE